VFTSSPEVFRDAVLDKEVRDSIWLSLYSGLIATLIGLVFGVPLAYILARQDFRGKSIVEGLIDVPIVIPHTAAGIALLFVFGRQMFFGKAFHSIGIDFVGATPGIVVVMLFVGVPFLIDSAKEGFKAVDPRLEKVARTLGASPWQAFLKISLPLAWRSIISGSVMMWARGISEFGAVLILVYYPMVATILIARRYESYGLESARPVTVLLILICLVIFVVLRVISYKGVEGARREKP
jgi:molybdate/tungstate transport system permease protein